MQTIAKMLNVKPHYVWNWEKNKRTLVYTAVDCETHLGTDNRFYVIDAARGKFRE